MQENGIKPTKGAYEAVIRVCGRAGPEYVGEVLRLAREMSDHYPIAGASGRGLWCALLEGCKRAGDLKKARWILAEAVRGSRDGAGSRDAMVDAELMTHVFHTYASYNPPFRRETTRLVDGSATSHEEAFPNESQVGELSSQDDPAPHVSNEQATGGDVFPDVPAENMQMVPSFSRLPPQTSSDIIAETRALFDRILQDRSLSSQEVHHAPQGGLLVGAFARVELTPVLLNAYLSVFYRHASIEASRETFDALFNDAPGAQALHPDEYTYVNALERCATARTEDRHIAVQWAKDVWRRWEGTEEKGLRDGKVNVGSFARMVERAHATMRRVLILYVAIFSNHPRPVHDTTSCRFGDVDGALALLRSFVSRYPPNTVLRPTGAQSVSHDPSTRPIVSPTPTTSPSTSTPIPLFAKPPILSTRTVLTNPASVSPSTSTARPLVRLTSVVTPKDDRVPPVIGFSDVDLLHARLAERGRIKDVGYVKWACMAYAGALKKRREAVFKATPTRDGDGVD